MNWTEFFIRRYVFTWMLMLALIFFGGFTYFRLGLSEFPDVESPFLSVEVSVPGAAPEVIELDVIEPIESAISAVAGIKKISSSASMGQATVSAEFETNIDIKSALGEVQAAIQKAMKTLPREAEPPLIRKSSTEDAPILWISVAAPKMGSKEAMALIRDQIKPQFSVIDGVADVSLGGYVDPALRVWVDPEALASRALTVSDVVNAISNEHVEKPGGRFWSGMKEASVRTYGEARSVDEFKNLPIIQRGGSLNYQRIRIGDVAKVEDDLADIRSVSRTDGQPAVGLAIRKQRGSNAVEVAELVKARMKSLADQYKGELQFTVSYDSTKFIEESIHELIFSLILAAILTAVVIWAFLGSREATFNIILAIPTSIIGTFCFMYAMGYTLNTFTLMALSLAVGIVVDDAIMILENILRHRDAGASAEVAAVQGTQQVFFPAIATSLSLIAIFMPVAFIQGQIGTYLLQFAAVLSVAIIISTLEALSLTPMRCARYMHEPPPGPIKIVERFMTYIETRYQTLLAWSLGHKKYVVGGAIGLFAVSLGLAAALNREFVPYQDTGLINITVRLPLGSSLEMTNEKMKKVEQVLKTTPEIKTQYVIAGDEEGDVTSGKAYITLFDKPDRPSAGFFKGPRGQREIAEELRGRLKYMVPGTQIFVVDRTSRGFGGGSFPIDFSLRGPDWDKLTSLAEEIRRKLGQTGAFSDIDLGYSKGAPEVQIKPNRRAALDRQVNISEINQTLATLLGGSKVGRYTNEGHRYDVIVKTPRYLIKELGDLKSFNVRNNVGELTPVGTVVDLKMGVGVNRITREDKQKALRVTANITEASSGAEAQKIAEEQVAALLPAGYKMEWAGASSAAGEASNQMFLAIFLGIVATYMVLSSQFNSFSQPVLILLALPFSLSGAWIALLLTGQTLNIFSWIGLMLVFGIVLKNSIMLVDFTNQKVEEGLSVEKALMEACPLRLRPIFMTAICTFVGALPAAVAFGPGGEVRMPMAVTVIGGLVVSTALTLFVVPVAYLWWSKQDFRFSLDHLMFWKRRKKKEDETYAF